jgi:hypothetical protein
MLLPPPPFGKLLAADQAKALAAAEARKLYGSGDGAGG